MPEAEEALIGFCGFWFFHEPPRLELLYGIAPAYWNRGLATEAARAMMRYGFEELSFERIEASTDAANLASSKVMERAGMSFWKREPTNGLDTVYYAISREAFDRRFRAHLKGEYNNGSQHAHSTNLFSTACAPLDSGVRRYRCQYCS